MTKATQREIDNRFTYHAPDDEKVVKHQAIRNGGKELAELIDALVPEGREKSLAVTKVEEAVMWANAGLARSEG